MTTEVDAGGHRRLPRVAAGFVVLVCVAILALGMWREWMSRQTALQGAGTLTLRDLSGRELVRRAVPAGQAEIDFDLQVPRGVWLAEVRQGNALKVARIAVP